MTSAGKLRELDVPDVDLLVRVGLGDVEAFDGLHRRFEGFVRHVVHRVMGGGHEADDVCQNVFLAIWIQAKRFDPTRAPPTTWIALVTRSAAVDALRANRRRRPSEAIDGREVSGPFRMDHLEEAEANARIHRALHALPMRQRSIVTLAYSRGLSRHQIAGLEGLPVNTVKTVIRRSVISTRLALMAD